MHNKTDPVHASNHSIDREVPGEYLKFTFCQSSQITSKKNSLIKTNVPMSKKDN